MDILVLFPEGRDRFDRPVYSDANGFAYVDLDYQRNPRKCIATKYPAKNFYYGEPDIKLTGRDDGMPDLVRIIFSNR